MTPRDEARRGTPHTNRVIRRTLLKGGLALGAAGTAGLAGMAGLSSSAGGERHARAGDDTRPAGAAPTSMIGGCRTFRFS